MSAGQKRQRILGHFASALRSTERTDLVFVRPESPAMEFHAYRHGVYCDTFRYHQGHGDFAREWQYASKPFDVVDLHARVSGGQITPDRLAALRAYSRGTTSVIEHSVGLPLPVSVFIPRQRACR